MKTARKTPAKKSAGIKPEVKKAVSRTKVTAASKDGDVDQFMLAVDHPLKAELQAVRKLILSASPTISEGIKWNAPSFRVHEWFATVNVRGKDGVQLIMHFGAKVNAISTRGVGIDDPNGLLKWLGKDRATLKFRDMPTIKANGPALVAIVRQWIAHVP
jgi:hypothetical protein